MVKIKLGITGCMGRMGQQLITSSKKNKNFKLVTLTENRLVDKKFNGKPGGADKYYQNILCPKTFVNVTSMTSQYDITSDLSRTHTNKSLRVKIK